MKNKSASKSGKGNLSKTATEISLLGKKNKKGKKKEPDCCGNCFYSIDNKKSARQDDVFCRRYPPKGNAGERYYSGMLKTEWCGEHKRGARK